MSPDDTASSQPSETEPQHRLTPVSSSEQLGVNNAVNEQPKREKGVLEQTRTVQRHSAISPHLCRKPRSTSNRSNSPTLPTYLRNHVLDPVQIETGIDPIGWDSSWGLLKADFSLTGVSADTGGELVYFNVFPSPVSYKTFNSPIEITTTTLIRHLLATASSSSSSDQQPTARHSTVSTHRQHQNTRSEQHPSEWQTRTHLSDETLADPSQNNAPLSTEAPPDSEPQPSPGVQDASPQFSTQTNKQNSHAPDPSREPIRTGAPQQRQTDTPGTDETIPAAEPFDSSNFSLTAAPDGHPPQESPPEHFVGEPFLDTALTPVTNEAAVQNDQQTVQRTEPLVDHSTQSEIHQQFGLPRPIKSDERRPGEATLSTALPRDDPVTPIEDMEHGLDAIGIDSTQFGFDVPDEPQNLWPVTEPPEPVNDPFGVNDAVDHFGDTELFPDVTIDDPLTEAQDDLDDFQEPFFETEIRF